MEEYSFFINLKVNAETKEDAEQFVSKNLAYLIENVDEIKQLIKIKSQLESLCDDNK
jgi:hypothetical protein